jgi:hypothetical protein
VNDLRVADFMAEQYVRLQALLELPESQAAPTSPRAGMKLLHSPAKSGPQTLIHMARIQASPRG